MLPYADWYLISTMAQITEMPTHPHRVSPHLMTQLVPSLSLEDGQAGGYCLGSAIIMAHPHPSLSSPVPPISPLPVTAVPGVLSPCKTTSDDVIVKGPG